MVLTLLLSLATPVQTDTILTVAGTDLPLVFVEPGEFHRRLPEGGSQTVVLTSGFWLGKHEVTWDVWRSVMGWGQDGDNPRHPARHVSWEQVQDFLQQANESAEGWRFRLPTEAEWEYAARAGTTSPWVSGSDSLTLLDFAWVRTNAHGAVQEVGGRRPNPWGLHDMHGNVWEWVADWMGPYPGDTVVVDPTGPAQGRERVRRGGSVAYSAAAAQSFVRYQQPPTRGNGNLGFRIVALPSRT